MPLNIKTEKAHRLAKQLAQVTGTSITNAVTLALQDALRRAEERQSRTVERLITDLEAIALNCASLEVLDNRSPEDIIGYDKNGIPTHDN